MLSEHFDASAPCGFCGCSGKRLLSPHPLELADGEGHTTVRVSKVNIVEWRVRESGESGATFCSPKSTSSSGECAKAVNHLCFDFRDFE
jgi:hypothetical protein